jgi:RNA polymerase sigma-70 factor (ECF subfamily)
MLRLLSRGGRNLLLRHIPLSGAAMAYKDLPDYLLLEQIRSGKNRAFDILFERYFPRLYKYSLQYVQDTGIAKELVMDVMLRLWQKQGEITVENELAPYLFRAVKNAIFNHWRKKAFENVPIELQAHESLLVSPAADHQLQEKELEAAYQDKLVQLSPQCHVVFKMSRHEQMTHAEIADHLNLSVHTVKNHIKAALLFFRKNMNVHTDLVLLLWIGQYFL